ncbi:Uncharacterised protein [Segatella copri]|nr:Uncharacterised protein [Segatella copri]
MGVWIETGCAFKVFKLNTSHPSWVCGLKHVKHCKSKLEIVSHPSWVCGLKLFGQCQKESRRQSHPSWVCGLKPNR